MAEANEESMGTRRAVESVARPFSISDVEARKALVAHDCVISELAVIGSPAEWRDRTSRYAAVIGSRCVIREFVRVHAGCERHTIIGDGSLLMSGCHIGHDAVIGEDCEIAPNAVIGGCVTLGDSVRIGMNATINPHVVVGDGARVGSGAVVNHDVPAGETWVGVPARRIR